MLKKVIQNKLQSVLSAELADRVSGEIEGDLKAAIGKALGFGEVAQAAAQVAQAAKPSATTNGNGEQPKRRGRPPSKPVEVQQAEVEPDPPTLVQAQPPASATLDDWG